MIFLCIPEYVLHAKKNILSKYTYFGTIDLKKTAEVLINFT